jgi:hypothetical protein
LQTLSLPLLQDAIEKEAQAVNDAEQWALQTASDKDVHQLGHQQGQSLTSEERACKRGQDWEANDEDLKLIKNKVGP